MYSTCGFSCQAGGKECPFLTCGIRVCSFSRTSDILIRVIGEKIYVVFREGISECLAVSMELNCQAIVDFWLQFWKSLGNFFPLYHSDLLSPLLFYVSNRRALEAFENRMVKDSLVARVRAAGFFIFFCVPHGGILKHVLLF